MTGAPMTVPQSVPVPIWERLFWERVTPKKVAHPGGVLLHELRRSAVAGRAVLAHAERGASCATSCPRISRRRPGRTSTSSTTATPRKKKASRVEGVEIWYRAAIYDDTVRNPDLLRCLVLIKGLEQPVKHMDSPYQEFDPRHGPVVAAVAQGLPDPHPHDSHAGGLSAYVMSDCSISRPQVNELNKFREQQIKLRDSNVPLRMVNSDVIPREAFEKALMHTDAGDFIFLPADAFAGEGAIREIAKATYPRENFAFEEKQDNDIARTHAMDSNQGGVKNDTRTDRDRIAVDSGQQQRAVGRGTGGGAWSGTSRA